MLKQSQKKKVYCPLHRKEAVIYYVPNILTGKLEWNGCDEYFSCEQCRTCAQTHSAPPEPISIFNG